MSEEQEPTTEQTLDALLGTGEGSNPQLDQMAQELTTVAGQISALEKREKELKTLLMSALDSMGATSVKAGGRRIGITERTYYGINKEKLAEAKAWIERVAPEANIPAAQNVAKAVEAFRDTNPGVPLPEFITSSVTRIFTNAKA